MKEHRMSSPHLSLKVILIDTLCCYLTMQRYKKKLRFQNVLKVFSFLFSMCLCEHQFQSRQCSIYIDGLLVQKLILSLDIYLYISLFLLKKRHFLIYILFIRINLEKGCRGETFIKEKV